MKQLASVRNSSLVTHSNQLTEARYSLTLGEQKVVLFLIAQIAPDDTDLHDYNIRVQDFGVMMGLKGNSLYQRMDETLDRLLSRVIHIPKATGYLKVGWVSSAEYIKGQGVVQLRFDGKLKPYLLQLREQFTRYRLFVVTQFQSAYSVRIYMLLKQYERIGEREFDLQEFREMLGIEKKKYAQFKDFRKWVLNQAKKEFDRRDEQGAALCDITFDLETIREGRRIARLKFYIRRNQYQESLLLGLPKLEKESSSSEALNLLLEYGIRESLAIRYLEEQGEAALMRCIALYREALSQGKVKDRSGGYLARMLEAGAGKANRAQKELDQQVEQETQQKQSEKAAKALIKEKERLGKEFIPEALEAYLSGFTEEQQQEMLVGIRQENPMMANMMASLQSPAVAAILVRRIPDFEKRKKQYIEDILRNG
ncbi:MAG: replication initiation protein [Endozoicomonas sp.]